MNMQNIQLHKNNTELCDRQYIPLNIHIRQPWINIAYHNAHTHTALYNTPQYYSHK